MNAEKKKRRNRRRRSSTGDRSDEDGAFYFQVPEREGRRVVTGGKGDDTHRTKDQGRVGGGRGGRGKDRETERTRQREREGEQSDQVRRLSDHSSV